MPDDLYGRDVLAWVEAQADLLRRLRDGERINAAVDWPNLIEEVQDLGRAELHAVESLLVQALVHLLKSHAWPDGPVRHWSAEVIGFLAGARRRFTPFMRQRLAFGELYRDARAQVAADEFDDASFGGLPLDCPFSLPDLVADPTDVGALRAKLGG
jgi:hypothetical protein